MFTNINIYISAALCMKTLFFNINDLCNNFLVSFRSDIEKNVYCNHVDDLFIRYTI